MAVLYSFQHGEGVKVKVQDLLQSPSMQELVTLDALCRPRHGLPGSYPEHYCRPQTNL